MFPAAPRLALLLALAVVSACAPRPEKGAGSASDAPAEAGYLTPPVILAARAGPGGVALTGQAAPGARVRLATPAGEARVVAADPEGRWTLTLPPVRAAAIYGLSMTLGARQVQAQGYLLVTPAGQAAMLRSGAGAVRLDRPGGSGIGAFDFDRGGGAVISGWAPARAVVLVRLDGNQAAEGRADEAGRFEVPLPPIGGGVHRLQIYGDGFQDEARVQTAAAAPLAGGPLRSQLSGSGLRADWMTPGGGVQSTVLID
ncbi:hypothetical protein [Phenylobacterium sp.]|uniref:hypothetical protein n=1 Tax=Phenylobacterium sp. TaxID=1871053 RepID=UPI002C1D90B7|nr:hypothetical protein [Phenylobacterium sp.]HVI33103.1 hypothetical protein [Phenylobacterium sp.]